MGLHSFGGRGNPAVRPDTQMCFLRSLSSLVCARIGERCRKTSPMTGATVLRGQFRIPISESHETGPSVRRWRPRRRPSVRSSHRPCRVRRIPRAFPSDRSCRRRNHAREILIRLKATLRGRSPCGGATRPRLLSQTGNVFPQLAGTWPAPAIAGDHAHAHRRRPGRRADRRPIQMAAKCPLSARRRRRAGGLNIGVFVYRGLLGLGR